MPSDKIWTMNCVLCGAKVSKLLTEGRQVEAEEMLLRLTSELTPQDVNYLISRLKG